MQTKVEQIQPINLNQFFIVKTKGQLSELKKLRSELWLMLHYWCCTNLSSNQSCDKWAITAPSLVLPWEPTGRCGSSDWNLHTNTTTSHLGTCHQSGPTAAFKPQLICHHNNVRRWPETGLLLFPLRWRTELADVVKRPRINQQASCVF